MIALLIFSATTNIDQSLTLLLDFVQQSNFTDEAVEREQGIIEQELLMYLDKPSTAIYTGLLEAMFEKNHVRIDIGGTLSSIKKINKDLLDLCYQTFYHPSNMVLVVVGKFDAEHIMTLIKENQAKKLSFLIKRLSGNIYVKTMWSLNHQLKEKWMSLFLKQRLD